MPKKEKTKEIETAPKLAIFKGARIRRLIHNDEWWFSVIDVVGVLTDSDNPRDYWYKMKIREKSESEFELSTVQIRGSGWENASNRLC